MCCKINQIRAASKGRNVTKVRSTRCFCKHTHVCCRIKNQNFSQASTVTKVWPTTCCCGHTHVLKHKPMQSCTEAQCRRRFGRPNSWEYHTHVCRRTDELRLAREGQRIPRFGRTVVAAGTHMCVAGYVSSGLRPTFNPRVTRVSPTRCCCEHTHVYCRNQGCTQRSKLYQGFADQVLL